jgi:hypothetical protein
VSFSRFAFRCALRLLPAAFHREYGEEMEALFVSQLASVRGRAAALTLVAGTLWDILRRAPAEHWRRRGQRSKEIRMSFTINDLKYALRSFARQPGATALIVVTLSLAVAANIAVFTLPDGVFFRPFPFPERV